MKKLPNNQRSAREKYYEQLYLKEKEKNEKYETKYIEIKKKLDKAEQHIKELEYFQTLTPEEREEIKIAIKKISEFQSSDLGQFMGSSLMPVLSIFKRIGTM